MTSNYSVKTISALSTKLFFKLMFTGVLFFDSFVRSRYLCDLGGYFRFIVGFVLD